MHILDFYIFHYSLFIIIYFLFIIQNYSLIIWKVICNFMSLKLVFL